MKPARILSIAPMMEYTDKHFRYLTRLIAKNIYLYTEMVHADAVIFGNPERFLSFNPEEQPVAIQLGGSCPNKLAKAAKLAESAGFCEVNLNVGCPSERVQAGKFGACLMAEPLLVADCIAAMRAVIQIPVTVKTRIGIDDKDSYAELCHFIQIVQQAGCEHFIIHARKAWLQGLSPKENRTIPPLHYETVYQLKKDMPQLEISINGGIKTLSEVQTHLSYVDGVMIGREAYHNPFILQTMNQALFDEPQQQLTRDEILEQYKAYMAGQIKKGVPLKAMTKHLLGLYHQMPNARIWRGLLSSGNALTIADIKTPALI